MSLKGICGVQLKQYGDTEGTRNWELIHAGGAHTLEHHDAAGYATFIIAENGCKVWGIVQPKGYSDARTYKELNELNELFIRADWKYEGHDVPKTWRLKWEEKGGTVYAIMARPGMLM